MKSKTILAIDRIFDDFLPFQTEIVYPSIHSSIMASYIRWLVGLFIRSFALSFVVSLFRSFVPSLPRSLRSCFRSFIRAFVHSFVLKFVRSLLRSCAPSVRLFAPFVFYLFIQLFFYGALCITFSSYKRFHFTVYLNINSS